MYQYLPSNAQLLRRLFHKHYSILVRLHCIGTPTTRPGPECWRLEAASVIAPQIASFLVPTPPREAVAYWTNERHSTDDRIMGRKMMSPVCGTSKHNVKMDFVYYLYKEKGRRGATVAVAVRAGTRTKGGWVHLAEDSARLTQS